jgi:hypothetical protein
MHSDTHQNSTLKAIQKKCCVSANPTDPKFLVLTLEILLTLLKKKLICSKNIEHIFVFATSSKTWAVLHVYRGSMDTGNKAFVQFNENSRNCV